MIAMLLQYIMKALALWCLILLALYAAVTPVLYSRSHFLYRLLPVSACFCALRSSLLPACASFCVPVPGAPRHFVLASLSCDLCFTLSLQPEQGI